MKKTILTFGLISAAILTVMMALTTIFASKIGFDRAELIGYTSMIISFAVIWFALVSYRNSRPDKRITFWQSMQIGLMITLISSICYVALWLVIYYTIFPDFMEQYGRHMLEKAKAAGATDAEIQKQAAKLHEYTELFKNPFINAALTFTEPLPVGLIISLLSSGIVQWQQARRIPA